MAKDKDSDKDEKDEKDAGTDTLRPLSQQGDTEEKQKESQEALNYKTPIVKEFRSLCE